MATLRTQQDYNLVLDLSALAYQTQQNGSYVISSAPFAASLKKLVDDPTTTQLDVDVYLLYDQRFFAPLSAKEVFQTSSVSITKIRDVKADQNLVIPTNVALKDYFSPELSRFRYMTPLLFPLKTNRREGSTSLGLSVWYKGVPVQEILLPPVCLSNSPSGKCDTSGVPTASFSGIDSGLLVGVDRASQVAPAFALHLIDLQERGTIAVFKCNTCPTEPSFFTWTITSSLADLGQQLKGSILLNVDVSSKIGDPSWLDTAGRSILRLLFNGDNPEDSKAAIRMLADTIKNADAQHPPVLFVRAITAGQDPLFLLPIGMAAIDTTDNKIEYLGFHFRIETPLLNASYKTGECLDKWRVLIPPKNVADGPLSQARDALQSGLQYLGTSLPECTGAPSDSICQYTNMRNFSNWIAKDSPVQPNLILLLLGHHDNDRIYWGATDAIPASLFSANFQQPSVVVFNACGTAKPGETHLLRNLNQNGVSTVIATYSEVPGAMAGKFSSLMIYNLHQHKSDVVGYSLAQAVFDSTLQLRDESIPPSPGIPAGAKYGAFALLFGLIGNGGVRICFQ